MTAAPPTLKAVQQRGTMMWVLEGPAAASSAAPTATPPLDTQRIAGHYTRVLREPGPAAAAAARSQAATSVSASRPAQSEQVLPNGARMRVLPADTVAPLAPRPALAERLIDPAQPGTQPGDAPSPNTLYRVTPPR